MTWLTSPIRVVVFGLWYVWALFTSNFAVLKDNLTPGQDSTTGIARYEAHSRTDGELTLIAALITLTPGTLTLGTETTPDGQRVLYVHGLYAADAKELCDELEDMETRMLHAVRRNGEVQ